MAIENQKQIDMKEIWKKVPGSDVMVSNMGNVRGGNAHVMVSAKINGKYTNTGLHQLVAMAFLGHKPNGHKMVVDHINNNGLDNRVVNLQVISNRENASKDTWRRKNGKTSKYIGVSFDKRSNKWGSRIVIDGENIHLGSFDTELDAAKAYQEALTQHKNGKSVLAVKDKYARKTTSKYVGVHWDKIRNRWVSQITVGGRPIFLGYFDGELNAAKAYREALKLRNVGESVLPAKDGYSKTIKKTSKYMGVSFYKRTKKWVAQKTVNKRYYYLGVYKTEEEAHLAVLAFEKKMGL